MRTVRLEDNINEILDQAQETGETIAVTKGEEVIAHLVPANMPPWLTEVPDWMRVETDTHRSQHASAVDDLQNVWANFDRLVAKLGVHWPEGVSAIDAIRDVRRKL